MEALGLPLILLSIPLACRWVPRNRLYGFRVAATLQSDAVWYEVNALAARGFMLLGLLMVSLEFVLPMSVRNRTLWIIAAFGVVAIISMSWRMANRLDRKRNS